MSSDQQFDGPPLVAGSVNGLRCFGIDEKGRLTGVTAADSVFRPGVNTAMCRLASLMVAGVISAPANGGAAPGHKAGAAGCTCGYWGFYDGTNEYLNQGERIAGIIEGFGQVTLGERGFRAEKARLLALIAPPARTKRRVITALGIYERAGVPIYTCDSDALAAHPVTHPQADTSDPRPEDVPGFWDDKVDEPLPGFPVYLPSSTLVSPGGFMSPFVRAATTTAGIQSSFASWNANTISACNCPLCR